MKNQKPVFLLAGGKGSIQRTPDPLIQTALKETQVSFPSVAYVGTASGDNTQFFHRISSLLLEAGVGKVIHAVISPEGSNLEKAQEILRSADTVFISGGDVDEGMRVLNQKRMASFLRELYEAGKLFIGVSAGSIMLANKWVRWPNPNNNSCAELFPCLGFAPIICDTHDEQDGWEELKFALSLSEVGTKGYGINSGTAIKVYSDARVEALGGAVHQFIRRIEGIVRVSDIQPTT
jgi:peptidase E